MKTIDAINLALNLLIQSQRVSLLIQKAHAEGRSQLKPEESKAVQEERDAALAQLDKEIASAEGSSEPSNN